MSAETQTPVTDRHELTREEQCELFANLGVVATENATVFAKVSAWARRMMFLRNMKRVGGDIQNTKKVVEYEAFNDPTTTVDDNGTLVTERSVQRTEFIDEDRGKIAQNVLDYPRLDGEPSELEDVNVELRTQMMQFLMEYNAAVALGVKLNNPEEMELIAGYCDDSLKRMALVESAQFMRRATDGAEYDTAREQWSTMNTELYGEVDPKRSASLLKTVLAKLDEFKSNDAQTSDVVNTLRATTSGIDVKDAPDEEPLLDEETLATAKKVIEERYADVLSVIPETDDSVEYNVDQCRYYINEALKVAGLYEKGWRCVIGEVSSPDTNVDTKKITISSSEKRTANQLRYLVLHEVEVHARRGQNGIESGSGILKKGTADYGDVEEGLGVLLEIIYAGDFDSPALNRARDRYIFAALVEGVNGNKPMDADTAQETMWRLLAVRKAKDGVITKEIEKQAKAEARAHVENAFRGTSFRDAGLIYRKLITYYEGLLKNAAWLKENIHDLNSALDKAMVGKHNHTDADESKLAQKMAA